MENQTTPPQAPQPQQPPQQPAPQQAAPAPQAQTKACPKCQEQILKDAKKCKHCNADLRNWFVRHKIMTAILIVLILGAISGGGATTQQATSNINETNCLSITKGMTPAQVESTFGEPASWTSSTESMVWGDWTTWRFNKPWSWEHCNVVFHKGVVIDRSWSTP